MTGICYTSPNEQDVIAANAQIEANCGIPCPGTPYWSLVYKAYDQDLYFIFMPGVDGWGDYTQEEMIAGVINVDIQPFNPNWFAPNPPSEGA